MKRVSNFVHLHLHSNYSLLSGASPIESLLERAKRLSMKTIALTDTGNLYTSIPFYQMARQYDLKPIIGTELRIGRGKIVLLARDRRGYSNLCRIITARKLNEEFSIEKSLLPSSEGLYFLSENVEILEKIARAVGKERVFAELVGWGRNISHLRQTAERAKRAGFSLLATNDVHFVEKEDFELHRILSAIREKSVLSKLSPEDLAGKEAYLKSTSEMMQALSEFPEAIQNSVKIAEECNLELELGEVKFPQYPLPESETSYSFLSKRCLEGLRERYRPIPPEAIERLTYELGVINHLGLSDYFILVGEIVRFARQRGIPVVGRGSAASSIVAYLLKITDADPLKYKLYFERFINPSRRDLPDIDIDLCWRRRDEVIQYVYETYGSEKVAMISTRNTFQARSAFREVAKVFGISNELVNRLSRRIPHGEAINLTDSIQRAPECRSFPIKQEPFRTILRAAERLAGFPRHLGIHCGGIVIAPRPLTEYLPLERAAKGIIVTQFEMNAVEAMGLVKMDLLGQRALTELAEAREWIRKRRAVELDLDSIPDGDPETVRLLRSGKTLSCFQIESPCMRATLQELRVSSIDELIAAISVVRPGPAGIGMKETFLRRARGEEPASFLHPKLKEVLNETFGVMLYQEDILKVARAVAGFTLAEGDRLREAISKRRSPEKMKRIEAHFLKKSIANGLAPSVARAIWKQIEKFASYSFCKAHAATYAFLAYKAAYLKAHYPLEFMTAVINNHAGMYPKRVHIEEAKRLGVKILPPHVNRSDLECRIEKGKIRMGLLDVRNLTRASAEAILDERRKKPFSTLGDFLSRVKISCPEVENLILVGALDGLGRGRPELLWELMSEQAGREESKVAPLAGWRHPRTTASFKEYDLAQKVSFELEILDAAISAHPLQLLRPKIKRDGYIDSRAIRKNCGRKVRLLGLLIAARKTPTKRGAMMEFLTFEDEYGTFEVALFPSEYRRFAGLIDGYGPYEIEGEVESNFDALSVRITDLRLPDSKFFRQD